MYVNKKRNAYGFGVGLDQNFSPILYRPSVLENR